MQGGADVALNTLTSPGMVAATLATLTPGGAFVEISKRDIWSPARVAQGENAWLAWQAAVAVAALPQPATQRFRQPLTKLSNISSASRTLLMQSGLMSPTACWLLTSCLPRRCMHRSCVCLLASPPTRCGF